MNKDETPSSSPSIRPRRSGQRAGLRPGMVAAAAAFPERVSFNKRRGPKSKLTAWLASRAIYATLGMATQEVAASAAGINRATLRHWLQIGDEHGGRDSPWREHPEYELMRNAIDRCLAYQEAEAEEGQGRRSTRPKPEDFGPPETYAGYVAFTDAMNEALANAEFENLQGIQNSDDWKAKAWILERLFPETYSLRRSRTPRNQADTSADHGGALVHLVVPFSEDYIAKHNISLPENVTTIEAVERILNQPGKPLP